jgi:hypothetical protein
VEGVGELTGLNCLTLPPPENIDEEEAEWIS